MPSKRELLELIVIGSLAVSCKSAPPINPEQELQNRIAATGTHMALEAATPAPITPEKTNNPWILAFSLGAAALATLGYVAARSTPEDENRPASSRRGFQPTSEVPETTNNQPAATEPPDLLDQLHASFQALAARRKDVVNLPQDLRQTYLDNFGFLIQPEIDTAALSLARAQAAGRNVETYQKILFSSASNQAPNSQLQITGPDDDIVDTTYTELS